MYREIIFGIISALLGSCAFGLHLSRLFFGEVGKRIIGYSNIGVHIALFISLFFCGASLEVILLIFTALTALYFLLEYIKHKREGGA